METKLQQTIQSLLAGLERTFPYASALYMKTEGTRAALDNREQSLSPLDPNSGIVFTVFNGNIFEELSTSETRVDELAREVKRWSDDIPSPANSRFHFPAAEEKNLSFITSIKQDPSAIPANLKLDLLKQVQNRAQGLDQRIINAQIRYSDSHTNRTFLRSNSVLDQTIIKTLVFLTLVVGNEQNIQYSWLAHAGTAGFELTDITDEELANLKDDAIRLLSAIPITPGDYEVVTDNTVSGVIAHECFGHGVEMDLFPKMRARSADYIGKQVAASQVNMFDDPSFANAYGSYFFDDEGIIAQPTQILKDGILINALTDFYSSLSFPHLRRSANGRRESFARKAYARMSNTFFEAGDTAPQKMLESLEDGIYLRQSSSGMEDPIGWGVQVTAHIGEEYKHGKPTGRIFSPVGITGYVPELLGSITSIGSDLKLDGGTCGKGHKEWVSVSSGGPHLRMKARLG